MLERVSPRAAALRHTGRHKCQRNRQKSSQKARVHVFAALLSGDDRPSSGQSPHGQTVSLCPLSILQPFLHRELRRIYRQTQTLESWPFRNISVHPAAV